MNYSHCAKRYISLLLCVTVIVQTTLMGCSDSTTPEVKPAPHVPTVTVTGIVDTEEIGGERLKVISAWDEGVPVSGNNDYQIKVSKNGAQLLFAADEDDSIRALSISIPPGGNPTEQLRFDARSTALSLVMMTPGILAVDAAEAALRFEQLQDLDEFQTLVDMLRDRLPSQCLSEVVGSPDVTDAMRHCITAWVEREALSEKAGVSGRLPSGLADEFSGFWADIVDTSQRSNVIILLQNQSWRFINVYRRLIDQYGNAIRFDPLYPDASSMAGAVPVSWACYFLRNCGAPTKVEGHVDLTCAVGADEVEYWASGWGRHQGVPLPDDIAAADSSAAAERIFMSVFTYIVVPLIGLFVGCIHPRSAIIKAGKLIYSEIKYAINILDAAERIRDAHSEEEIRCAVHAIVCLTIGWILFDAGALAALGIPGIDAPFLSLVTLIFNIAFTGTNLVLVSVSWTMVPRVSKVSIASPWAGEPCDDETPPAAVTDLRVLGVTGSTVQLAWTAIGDDGVYGQASFNDVRCSTQEISEENWNEAMDPQGEPVPPPAGSEVTFIVRGLERSTRYWFAVKTGDEVPNWSGVSNVVSAETTDEPVFTRWNILYDVDHCTLKSFSCSPAGCGCPPPSTVYGFCPSRGLNIWGLEVEARGDSVSGFMAVSDATVGSYIINTGQVEMNGTIHDGYLDFEITLTGSLDDIFLDPGQNPFAHLDCTFTVSDAVVEGTDFHGLFMFEFEINSYEHSCYQMTYREEGVGSVSGTTSAVRSGISGIESP